MTIHTAQKADPTSPIMGAANPNVLPYYRFRVVSKVRNQYLVWDFKLNRPVMDAETGFVMMTTRKWEAERIVYVMTARILMATPANYRKYQEMRQKELSDRYIADCVF